MNILKVLILAVLSACIISGILMIALPPKIQKKEEYKYWYFYSSEYYLDKVTDTEIGHFSLWFVGNKRVTHVIRSIDYPGIQIENLQMHALPLELNFQLVDTSTIDISIKREINVKTR